MDGQEEEPAEEVEGSALGGSGFRVPLRQPQASAEDDADAAEYADHFARTIMQFKRGSLPRSAASLPEAGGSAAVGARAAATVAAVASTVVVAVAVAVALSNRRLVRGSWRIISLPALHTCSTLGVMN